MDKTVTLRFFEVEDFAQNGPDLRQVLREIAALDYPAREANLGPDFFMRLENFEEEAQDLFLGDFIRIQDSNFPSEVHDDGTHPLENEVPLGHSIVFAYNSAQNVIGLQYDNRIISGRKIELYLNRMQPQLRPHFNPKLSEDEWDRFARGDARYIKIGVASPNHLDAVEGDDSLTIAQSLTAMGDAYNAPIIEVKISMGQTRNRNLPDNVKNALREFVRLGSLGAIDLRQARTKIDTGPGEPNDEINLLNEFLKKKEILDLPDNDPPNNYEIRKNFIRATMIENGFWR